MDKRGGDLTAFEHRVQQALRQGAKIKAAGVFEWDSAPYCSGDVVIQQVARFTSDSRMRRNTRLTTDPGRLDRSIFLDQKVPCRICPPCLRRRAAEWRHRSKSELEGAARTWFVTLTLDPQHHWISTVGKPKGLDEHQEFAYRVKTSYREITRWLKRVRKNSGATIRYLLVAEAHKSGLPHFHLLIHEVSGIVTKRQIQSAWTWGFTTAKLADPKAAMYVTKYLSKSMLARVRSSLDYGSFVYQKAVTVDPQIIGENPREELTQKRSVF